MFPDQHIFHPQKTLCEDPDFYQKVVYHTQDQNQGSEIIVEKLSIYN